MRVLSQTLDDILAALGPLKVEWQDDTSRRVIAKLAKLPRKKIYTGTEVEKILDEHFDDGCHAGRGWRGNNPISQQQERICRRPRQHGAA